MAKPWLKMWVAWLHDARMVQLTLAERGAWWSLYTYAHLCGEGGRIISADGRPVDRKTLLDLLHIKTIAETRIFDSMCQKMLEIGSLQLDGEIMLIAEYENEQTLVPTDTKESIKSRVDDFRARQRLAKKVAQSMGIEFKEKVREQDPKLRDEVNRLIKEGVTDVTFSVPPTPPSSNVDKDIDIDIERNAITGVTPVVITDTNVTDNPLHPRETRAPSARNSRETSYPLQQKPIPGLGAPVTDNPLPEWIDPEIWAGWLEMRKKMGESPTSLALKIAINKLTRLKATGQDPNEILRESILNNWKGVFPLKRERNAGRVDARRPRTDFDPSKPW